MFKRLPMLFYSKIIPVLLVSSLTNGPSLGLDKKQNLVLIYPQILRHSRQASNRKLSFDKLDVTREKRSSFCVGLSVWSKSLTGLVCFSVTEIDS